jgi:DNA-binding response OmpR family regulator
MVVVRVLVVDDEPALRRAIEAVLIEEGFEVSTAADGAVALALLDEFRPDAIILDLRMPVMDGYAFLAAYRARSEPRPPVIVCSTFPPSADLKALGAVDYLRKPFDVNELVLTIRRQTESRPLTRRERRETDRQPPFAR